MGVGFFGVVVVFVILFVGCFYIDIVVLVVRRGWSCSCRFLSDGRVCECLSDSTFGRMGVVLVVNLSPSLLITTEARVSPVLHLNFCLMSVQRI